MIFFSPQGSLISCLTQEERVILHNAGVYDTDNIVIGIKKLLAEIEKLKEEVINARHHRT